MNIHYKPDTGEIVSWDNLVSGNDQGEQSHLDGCEITGIDGVFAIDTKLHKINLDTKELVVKTFREQIAAIIPNIYEVKGAILAELQATDEFVNPPLDRPKKDGVELDWIRYRAALRGLSKLDNTVAMIRAWPKRPDEKDAIPRLRERIPPENTDG